MRQMADLIGAKRAAPAGVVGPAKHPGLEKGAIDDQLPAALEQVEQGNLAPGPVEFVGLLHWYPGHPSPLGGQGITGARECLLLQKQPLPRFLPVLLRHHRGRFDRDLPFQVLRVSLVACWHVISPLFSEAGRDHLHQVFLCSWPMDIARAPPVDSTPSTTSLCCPAEFGGYDLKPLLFR